MTSPRAECSSDLWTEHAARNYRDHHAEMYDPAQLTPEVEFLAEWALRANPEEPSALEFAIGTGRVAVPLTAQGIHVAGIELSPHMVAELCRQPGGADIPVHIGSMADAHLDATFGLVYLVFNTLENLRTQAEQVACFQNAAHHLTPGGYFVVSLTVPPLRNLTPGAAGVIFSLSPRHTGLDSLDEWTQQGTSHHFVQQSDGSYRRSEHNYRYVWPAEMDLMAQLAGLEGVDRWADFARRPLCDGATQTVSVWRKPVAATT